MHVCMITREFPPEPGGISYYVYSLSKKLVQRGHKVTVITRGGPARSSRKMVEGIDVFRATFFPIYPFHVGVHGFFVNMVLKSLEIKPDLLHMHSPIVPPIKTSLPIMTTVHTPMKIDSKYHEVVDFLSLAEKVQSCFFSPPLESKLFRFSKSITSVSVSVAHELKLYGLDEGGISVIGNGVDESIFTPVTVRESAEKYVLYTGILRARKGLFDLLLCAEQVCRIRPEVRFLICGKGPFFRKLEEAVQKRGMGKKFVLLGHVTRARLIQLYQNAAVHVVPSHYEGLPTVLLEAMSCGLPVVATDIGGNNEVIFSGVNGLLVPPKAPKLFAEAILKLLNDDALRERIGKAARKTIEERYTWNRIADTVLDCYQSLLAQKPT